MNCPSRADPLIPEGYNQSPNALNADTTTRADMNYKASARLRSDHCIDSADGPAPVTDPYEQDTIEGEGKTRRLEALGDKGDVAVGEEKALGSGAASPAGGSRSGAGDWHSTGRGISQKALAVLRKYAKFVGPGFMVAVAYIDPGTRFF